MSHLSFPGTCNLPWYVTEMPQNPDVSCHQGKRLLQVI